MPADGRRRASDPRMAARPGHAVELAEVRATGQKTCPAIDSAARVHGIRLASPAPPIPCLR